MQDQVAMPAQSKRPDAVRGSHMAYLLAHFAKSQLWHASTLLFGFFLTEACDLNAWTMGWIMAVSLAFNGAMDAVVGAHRSGSPGGCTVRRQAHGAPLPCLLFLLFCATPLLEPAHRTLWAMTTLIAFRGSYSYFDVPQNAMVPLLAIGANARRKLLAWRNIASGLASLSVAILAAPLLIRGQSMPAWLLWAAAVAMLALFTAWRLQRHPLQPALPGITERSDPEARLRFAVVLAALAAMMVANTAFRSLEPYYAAYVSNGAGLLLWAMIGGIASQTLWIARGGREHAIGGATAIIVALLFAALFLLSPWRASPFGAAAAGLSFGWGTSGLWLNLWSAMMTAAAAGRGTARVGLFTCVSKLSQGAAMLLLGQVLATSRYRTTLSDALSAPALLMVVAPIAIAGACLVLMLAPKAGARDARRGTPALPRRAARPIAVSADMAS